MSTQELLRLPSLPSTIRYLLDDELAWVKKQYPDFYIPDDKPVQKRCITCAGQGVFKWYESDEVPVPVMWECNCRDQWVLFTVFSFANIWLVHQRLDWGDMEGIESDAKLFVLEFLDALKKGHMTGIFLYGNQGTGKSMLASLALKKLVSLGHYCYYGTFQDLLGHYQDGWRDAEKKAWFYQRIRNAKVLVIDDLGKEGESRRGVVEPFIDDVIRHRVASGYPTIITSNLDANTIGARYGDNVFWLMNEGLRSYEFRGENYRERFNKRADEERDAGLMRPIVVGVPDAKA